MNFPELCEAPPEVVAVLVLFVRAGIEEVDVPSRRLQFPSNHRHERDQLTLLTEQQAFTGPVSFGSFLSCFHLLPGDDLKDKMGKK